MFAIWSLPMLTPCGYRLWSISDRTCSLAALRAELITRTIASKAIERFPCHFMAMCEKVFDGCVLLNRFARTVHDCHPTRAIHDRLELPASRATALLPVPVSAVITRDFAAALTECLVARRHGPIAFTAKLEASCSFPHAASRGSRDCLSSSRAKWKFGRFR